MKELIKKSGEKISAFQKKSVSLHSENEDAHLNDAVNYRGAEAAVAADDHAVRQERLGVHAYETQGRPTLDCRWDTLVYEEGLQSEQTDHQLGGSRLAIRNESDRLIAVAKKVGDYIPSTIWESFGLRNNKPSGESVVFLDDKNNRVIKFKDPFAYIALKDDSPYFALYEHHIHNHFFGDVGYRFLGISQDPVSGGVRFAFEQPFIEAQSEKPTKGEIHDWFTKHGFELTEDGLFYTDGYVSMTDVWGDNCIKDGQGNLHFIDPIIKFDREPKEVISHYIQEESIEKKASVNSTLQRSEEIKTPTTALDSGSQIVIGSNNLRDTVKNIIRDSITFSFRDFSEEQKEVLKSYRALYPQSASFEEIYTPLFDEMKQEPDISRKPERWLSYVMEEVERLNKGEERSRGIGI